MIQLGAIVRQGTTPNRPQNDSNGGNGSGPGNVDPKKLKELSENWGSLPEKERAEALEEIDARHAAAYREVVEKYFKKLGDEGAARRSPKAPQVWKPQARPTFARVYVGDGNSLELVSACTSPSPSRGRARAPWSITSSAIRTTASWKAPSSIRCRPAPVPVYFAMFLGQTRDTMPPLLRRPRRRAAAAAGRPRPPDARPARQARQTPPTGARLQEARVVAKEKALETYEDIVARPDRPGPAGIRRRQHLQRPRLPDPAEGLQPRPHRLRGTAARRRRAGASIASRCPTAS